jgi:DNA repair exonuclease SbcCD ATPase subunit
MTRLTNERIERIRRTHGCLIPKPGFELPSCHERTSCDCTVTELLQEIEALRAERDEWRKKAEWKEVRSENKKPREEIEALRAERDETLELKKIAQETELNWRSGCLKLIEERDRLAERVKELEQELERERMRLAACGVAALGYFDGCAEEYKSASLNDVLKLSEREQQLRAAMVTAKEALERISTMNIHEVTAIENQGWIGDWKGEAREALEKLKEMNL